MTRDADGWIRDTSLMNEPVTQTSRIRNTIRIAEVPANIDFVNTALGYILFNLGAIRPSESIELQCINTVHFLKQHPNSTITLFGYGDKETGTEQVNLRISQERADYIKQILVQKYNVNPDRIQTKAMGCSVQPYQKEGLNRLVVIRVNP